MFPTIPDAPRAKLAECPLTQVICQVRFPIEAALAGDGDAAAAQVHERVEDLYPRLVKEMRAEIQITPDGPKTTQSPVWKFADLEAQWSVVLAPSHVTLEAVGAAYTDWADFRDRLQRILEAVHAVLELRICERAGLRYINEVRVNAVEALRGVIRPTFLGPFSDVTGEQLHQWLGQLHLREDSLNAVIRYGLPQSTDGLTFRIDTDCFDAKPKPYNTKDVLDQFTELNDVTYRAFAWILTPEQMAAYTEGRDA